MDQRFASLVETLAPKLEELRGMEPLRYGALPRTMTLSGVCLFSEGDRHMYVGRSNVLRKRHGRHCGPGATYRQAAFAFLLAREQTGRMKGSYKAGAESRAGLMELPEFRAAFEAAKLRIRKMDYRFVQEEDQTGKHFWKSIAQLFSKHHTTISRRIS
jgi:hypothetical protein